MKRLTIILILLSTLPLASFTQNQKMNLTLPEVIEIASKQ
jgi:hypothetical protein